MKHIRSDKGGNMLICGDFRNIMPLIEDDSIDMIITDPPYKREYMHLWEPLFKESARVLKPQGNFISLCGHWQVPEVLNIGREYLRFWWILWMKQTKINRLIGKGVAVLGKPAVWFLKEKRRPLQEYGYPFDTISASLEEDRFAKEFHEWGQSVNWFAHYIGELTKEGEMVLDPMCGSGSSLVAAKLLGRNYMGIDKELDYITVSKDRLYGIDTR